MPSKLHGDNGKLHGDNGKLHANHDHTAAAPSLTIALIEPCIPQNTGNIARLTVATGAKLILVGKLGFDLSDKYLKRAGMDYWQYVDYKHISMEEFEATCWNSATAGVSGVSGVSATTTTTVSFLSTHATKPYTEIPNANHHMLVFGNEVHGLPQSWYGRIDGNGGGDGSDGANASGYRIPMMTNCRSLNLSSSAAIIAYHLLSRNNFQGLG